MTMERLLAQNLEATRTLTQVVDSLRAGQGELAQLRRGITTPFDVQKFDLTTAHTDLEVRVLPCAYIQAISDGELYGVTINLVRQGAYTIDLSQVSTISAGNVNKLYLTNDVRAGRNTLWLYFHRIEPFGTRYTGDPVTNAEVAARLGSISTFDRRGEVIWFDDFEDNIAKWTISYSAGAGTVALSNAAARNGAQSAKMVTGATTSDDIIITRWLTYPFTKTKIGYEQSFCFQSVFTSYFQLSLLILTGSRYVLGSIRYNPITPTLEYQTTSGAWVSLTAVSLAAANTLFHTMKLVIDPYSEKYVRLILDANVYDLSAISLYAMGSSLTASMSLAFTFATLSANSRACYVDDAIVTQNEP